MTCTRLEVLTQLTLSSAKNELPSVKKLSNNNRNCCIPCKFPWKLTSYSWLVGHSWNPFHYFQAKNNVTKENLVSPSCSELLLEADPTSCTKEKESEISVTALPCSIILACSSGTFWVTALIPQPLLFHILCCCGKSRPV